MDAADEQFWPEMTVQERKEAEADILELDETIAEAKRQALTGDGSRRP